MKRKVKLFLVFALCWIPAHASTIFYSDSGTFSASTPSTAFSGPSETWAFSFEADSKPAVSKVTAGTAFDFAFSAFSYSLNGSPDVITPTDIRFFNSANEGGFALCFSSFILKVGCDGLGTLGPQMYTGPESAPTLLTGAFTSTDSVVQVGTTLYEQPNNTLDAVPEPSTLLPIAAGLLALAVRRLYWRR
jgi:hypothetical protein